MGEGNKQARRFLWVKRPTVEVAVTSKRAERKHFSETVLCEPGRRIGHEKL